MVLSLITSENCDDNIEKNIQLLLFAKLISFIHSIESLTHKLINDLPFVIFGWIMGTVTFQE
jgi:hypothetical protein